MKKKGSGCMAAVFKVQQYIKVWLHTKFLTAGIHNKSISHCYFKLSVWAVLVFISS